MTKFSIGQLVITANAEPQLPADEVSAALKRHMAGDWGDVDEHDRRQNDWSLENGERLSSSYKTADGREFWIITEADRSVTTILLPEDY